MRRTGAPEAAVRTLAVALALACCAAAWSVTLATTAPAPRALILDLSAEGIVYAAAGPVALPPGTDHFRIRYGAAGAADGQRFEYRLDGVDGRWMAAGVRRATSYTNIDPGAYTFRVRALAAGGPGPEAFMRLYVAPTFTQTAGFRLACAACAILAGALLYRRRVRYVTGRLADRLQVRTAERDRLARALHDTFLQTVQGLVLRVDAVAATLPPEDGARRQLEQVLDDASHALGAGRDQLQALRAGDVAVLESMLERVLADAVLRLPTAPVEGVLQRAIDLRVAGAQRTVAPAAADDIVTIVRAAIRHVWAHADAGRIRILLVYRRRALIVRIAADGRGAHARAPDADLAVMAECAARIGARLEVEAGRRRGATVLLTVPAACAYAAGAGADSA